MKIGILCREFSLLRNWELRIINELMISPSYTISLIIKDGRINKHEGINNTSYTSDKRLSGFLFKLQSKIENKLFHESVSVNKEEIINYLSRIESITLCPRRNGVTDEFSKEDSDKIKEYNLDLILKHEFAEIKGDIINSARYGIWELIHSDNRIIKNSPIGFWEIFSHQTCVGATLTRLTKDQCKEIVIERGYYINDYSYTRSRNLVYEYSVNLYLKNLNLLSKYKTVEYRESEENIAHFSGMPNLLQVIKYMLLFYTKLFRNAVERKIDSLALMIGKRPKCWAVFTSAGSVFNTKLENTTKIKPSKNEFWADPFIFKHKGVEYLLYENYEYGKKKGIISCGKLENDKISDTENILTGNYHLSYPFIFENNEGIFMTPESNQNKRLEIYKSIDFPTKWELYTTGFEGEYITDPTFFTDSENKLWLFVNKSILPVTDNNSELYIYQIDSLRLNKIIPHRNNPVVIDCRYGRNGGTIFMNGNQIIRPSQYNNFYGSYGYGLNLSIIKKLTLDEYEEELITTIRPVFRKGLIGVHHLCQREDRFVIDGRYRYL
ncbi:MAG: hypothetical protein WC644_08925 [Ignavibacteria bacterium]